MGPYLPGVIKLCLDIGQARLPCRVHAATAEWRRDALCALRLLVMLSALRVLLYQPGRELCNADLAAAPVLSQQLVTVPQQGILHIQSALRSLLRRTMQPGIPLHIRQAWPHSLLS